MQAYSVSHVTSVGTLAPPQARGGRSHSEAPPPRPPNDSMCVCIYIYIYMYVCVYYRCVCIYIYIYMYRCVYVDRHRYCGLVATDVLWLRWIGGLRAWNCVWRPGGERGRLGGRAVRGAVRISRRSFREARTRPISVLRFWISEGLTRAES